MEALCVILTIDLKILNRILYDGQEVAVKKLVGGGGGPMEKTLKDFKTECVLLSRLKHRNIIALVGATTHPVTCVMQYCSRGNLMVLLDDRRYYSYPWFIQLPTSARVV